ncbi:MAG: hypothetical protein ACI9W2_000807 [Gammaproteobacteria bacterium]
MDVHEAELVLPRGNASEDGHSFFSDAITASLYSIGGKKMNEERLNRSLRKFLKEVGVTSQREIENLARSMNSASASTLKVRMVLTVEGADFEHVVEGEIDLA